MAVATSDLPGGELVERGLTALEVGHPTPEAALVATAATRLRALGFDVPAVPGDEPAGHVLYARLEALDASTAHSQYKAMTRRLASFLRAAATA